MTHRPDDARTLAAATEVLEGRPQGSLFRRILPFLGPAFIACVAYVDPGNFATNIAGGAEFGYLLLWVIVASNLMVHRPGFPKLKWPTGHPANLDEASPRLSTRLVSTWGG